MKTTLFLLMTTLSLGIAPAQNFEKDYREFEASYTRGLVYSVDFKHWPAVWNKVAWKGVHKPLLRGFTAKNEVIKYAVFDDCVIVVVKSFHPLHIVAEHFPDYIVTEIPNDDAAAEDRAIYHLKRR